MPDCETVKNSPETQQQLNKIIDTFVRDHGLQALVDYSMDHGLASQLRGIKDTGEVTLHTPSGTPVTVRVSTYSHLRRIGALRPRKQSLISRVVFAIRRWFKFL